MLIGWRYEPVTPHEKMLCDTSSFNLCTEAMRIAWRSGTDKDRSWSEVLFEVDFVVTWSNEENVADPIFGNSNCNGIGWCCREKQFHASKITSVN